MGFSYHFGPLQVSGRLSLRLLLFGFALEGQGFLQLLGDVQGVEMPRGSYHGLEREAKVIVEVTNAVDDLKRKSLSSL